MVFDRIFHITFSEGYLHLLVPVVQIASDKMWIAFLTCALVLLRCGHGFLWEAGIFRSIVFKMFHKVRVACDLCSSTVCLLWSAADGCKIPWEEWILKCSAGRASEQDLLLLYNTILKIKGCTWKSLILLCPYPLPQTQLGFFTFFSKNNLNYSVT